MRERWFLSIPFLQSCLQSSKFQQLAGLQQIYSLLREPGKKFHYSYSLWQAKLPPPPFFLLLILLLSALTQQVVSTQVSRDTHTICHSVPDPSDSPCSHGACPREIKCILFALNKHVFKPTSGKKTIIPTSPWQCETTVSFVCPVFSNPTSCSTLLGRSASSAPLPVPQTCCSLARSPQDAKSGQHNQEFPGVGTHRHSAV